MTADTIGPQHDRAAAGTDPRGWLVFEHLPDDLQRAEDATQAADHQRQQFSAFNLPAVWGTSDPAGLAAIQARARRILTAAGMSSWRVNVRPATDAERTLLEHLGHELPAELFTAITYPSTGTRNRRWPQLESQEESA
ncbi:MULTISPECIES: hypothetical protein [Mycobacterium]|uniref:Uncharacterized protein n=1 Tax=Mycobacterium kiyosense TaxID=2871094 RepID=A0A9P3V059_9MYCO|nr:MULTISPECIES: hypothetical protein [Mycobacterium]BDB45386.1 hypothetical protein IWGMT90018_58320 [Mycobacterium kiyosense]BDE16850.1 hypothetical protein MKCMC460_57100 [Mycobacterium sp. 20KCMC460]GLB83066.1 hypothetical protein SRL2020028_23220 [Mycobacterium kiyosense]GLB90673.1 hypothetical protein SRL2020130_34900 [Mycobacterium kiyosense]GLB97424.1 hypothetical protein SRL2020226_42000 [Mycobacterium kiyosense]